MNHTQSKPSSTNKTRKFTTKARNFEISVSYEGLAVSQKRRTLAELKRQYAG